ncbi:hypothetical protein HIM_01503 [Hirsutella minnesotensis 3608]|nr:hypothetical protein HIM_01503 [Hirsutella minnesotensis 3608]
MTTSGPPNMQPTEAMSLPPEQLVVNLQVVSPSVGVNRPLLFPDLPATTTIKLLKDKIRQTLPLRPADENQRLIHRGRALVRDSDSLLDVFGADTLRTPDRQTIHLVIRDATEAHTPMLQTPARGPSPAEAAPSTSLPRPANPIQPQYGPDPPPPFAMRGPVHLAQPRMPSPAPSQHHLPEQAATFQQQHQNMANWLGQVQRDAQQRDAQLQREAMMRAFVSQSQRGRAQLGMRGIGDTIGSINTAGLDPNSGIVSPGTPQSVHYEALGPNGQTYQVDTVIRTTTQNTPGLTPVDVQNIIRSADAHQAASAMAMANALHRSASGVSLHPRPLTQPGVTAPILGGGGGGSLAGSGRATPDIDARTGASSTHAARASSPGQPQQGPQVYLVSSPEGPRALLFNASANETYYTPRLRAQASYPRLRATVSHSNLVFSAQSPQSHGTPQHEHRPQPRDRNEEAPPAEARPAAHPAHPANPPAAALPPLLLQFWPHIWLIFRLGLFIWFFTSPNASWSRWLTIILLAALMFVLSTGLLNGLAENAWRPLGRHLENLLPTLDHAQAPRGANTDVNGTNGVQGGDVSPERIAARLVGQRRARRGWLAGQFRRVERAGLLFLASLAPGVAERHIANLEAEARAEESRRRQAEEAAAAATLDAASADETATAALAQGSSSAGTEANESSAQEAADGPENRSVEHEGDESNEHGQSRPIGGANQEEVTAS